MCVRWLREVRQELSQLVKAVVNRRMAAVMVAAARWVEVVAVLRVMGEEKLAMWRQWW